MIKLLQPSKQFKSMVELYLQKINIDVPIILKHSGAGTFPEKDQPVSEDETKTSGTLPRLHNEGAFGGLVMNLIISLQTPPTKKQTTRSAIFHSPDQIHPERLRALAHSLFRTTTKPQPPNPANDSFPSNRGPI